MPVIKQAHADDENYAVLLCQDGEMGVCEALSDGPYLELFSRSSRDGWDAFGNEMGKFKGVAG